MSPSSLVAVGVMRITLNGPWHLRERGEGQWLGEHRRIWSPILTGSGQKTVYGYSRWWSTKFHRREWRWQGNGVSRWSGRGEHLGKRPGVSTRYPYKSSKGKMRRNHLWRAHSLERTSGSSFTQ